MKIKLTQDCGFEVVMGIVNDIPQTYDETFKAGEILEGDIVDDEGSYCSWQNWDGSMIFGLPTGWFEIIEE